MLGTEGSPWAVSESRVSEGVCVDSRNRGAGQGTQQKGNPLLPLPGVIEVIHATPGSLTGIRRKGALTVVPVKGHSSM